MNSFNSISYLLLVFILILTFTTGKSIDTTTLDNTIEFPSKENDTPAKPGKNDDQYYLVHVKNPYGEFNVFSESNKAKRQEPNTHILSLIDDINTLIIENKDTYKDPEALEEIEKTSQLRKRNNEDSSFAENSESDYVTIIGSINDKVVLLVYLSKPLTKDVKRFKNVEEVNPRSYFTSYHHYNVNDILKETQWKNLTVREDADNHLSMISQGIYQKEIIHQYDNNYYYPSSAGKDVDIVILDSGFNFDYYEFNNRDDRSVKCVVRIKDNEFTPNICGYDNNKHGDQVADCAGGIHHGSASRANIYAVALEKNSFGLMSESDFIAGLQYIYENLIRPNKTVINISLGKDEYKSSKNYQLYEDYINKITDLGGIIVTAAGNNNANIYGYLNHGIVPCIFNNTICVGGFDNSKDDESTLYTKAGFSNFGEFVDIYGPGYVNTEFIVNGRVFRYSNWGTSFASPLVSGVVATILSENPDTSFDKNSMLDLLIKNAEPFFIEGKKNYIINNGKHIVYSKDDTYYGCGISAGNRPCEKWCDSSSKICNRIQKYKHKCDDLFIYDHRQSISTTTNYACLVPYSKDDEESTFNVSNSACFQGNDQIYCVNSNSTIFKECDKSNDRRYNIKRCISKIFDLTSNNGIVWTDDLIPYSEN